MPKTSLQLTPYLAAMYVNFALAYQDDAKMHLFYIHLVYWHRLWSILRST